MKLMIFTLMRHPFYVPDYTDQVSGMKQNFYINDILIYWVLAFHIYQTLWELKTKIIENVLFLRLNLTAARHRFAGAGPNFNWTIWKSWYGTLFSRALWTPNTNSHSNMFLQQYFDLSKKSLFPSLFEDEQAILRLSIPNREMDE